MTSEDLAGRGEQPGPDRRWVEDLYLVAEASQLVWPGFDSEVVFELGIERVLLMLTQAEGPFPAGPSIWRAGDSHGAEAAAPSGIVT